MAGSMPEKSYEGEPGGLDLLRLAPVSLDDEIRAFLKAFAASSQAERRSSSGKIAAAGLHTLIQFAKRNALFAVRERDEARCFESLTALAAIDVDRIDGRDVVGAQVVVDAMAERVGLDRARLDDHFRSLASEMASAELTEFRQALPNGASISEWGFEIVDVSDGAALAASDVCAYAPSVDLLALAMRADDAIERSRYPVRKITVATALPKVWLGSRDARVTESLDRSKGTARLALAANHQRFGGQLCHLYFIEMGSTEDATWLAEAAAMERPGEKATIAFSAGPILLVAITASTRAGKPSELSAAELTAILRPVVELLRG